MNKLIRIQVIVVALAMNMMIACDNIELPTGVPEDCSVPDLNGDGIVDIKDELIWLNARGKLIGVNTCR